MLGSGPSVAAVAAHATRSTSRTKCFILSLLPSLCCEQPNAARQPRPKAGAQRTLEGVGWTRWLGALDSRDSGLPRLYPFNSFFSALKKRQSVPWAIIFWGVLLIRPTSRIHSA